MAGQTDSSGYLKVRINCYVNTSNTSNPPSQAELVAAFGAASATGAGWIGVLDDNNAHANVYIITSDGASYWYVAMTKPA